ncbi:Calcyphosin-like protein, partial [Globisporangium splendens]
MAVPLNISACIADDSDFELLMRQTWHVSPSEDDESESDQGSQRPMTSSHHSSCSRQPVVSKAHHSARTHEAKKLNSLDAEEAKSEKSENLAETDWKYLKSLLIPTRKPMALDDMSRRLGANRVWGDGSELMQGKVFAHALTLLDKQLNERMRYFFHIDWRITSEVLQPALSTPSMTEGSSSNTVIGRVRNRLLQRISQSSGSNTVTHGIVDATALSHIGLNGLQRNLRLIDTNGDKRLTKDELKSGLRKFGVDVSFHELDCLFTFFDADRSGCISVDEFLVGMRGEMDPRRLAFVNMAFDLLDKDGDGVVTLQELASAYDTSKHPDVINGKLTTQDALRLFAAQWESEKERDGVVTKLEFEEYYRNLSASIDSDEYFELMMRNAWHISGGEGVCANSTNRRVLVTKSDNTQTVEEVMNDLGIRATDCDKIHVRLSQQGVAASQRDKNSKKPGIEMHYGTVVSTKKAGDPTRSREAQPLAADSLAPPWQKKQMSAREHAANQARQPPPGRLFHRRRVLDMESSVQRAAQNGYSTFPGQDNGYPDSVGDAKQSREQARNTRQRAAQLIQSHFRGSRARKFVDCVRRKHEAEKLHHLQFQTPRIGNGTRSKVLRPALKAYHGF